MVLYDAHGKVAGWATNSAKGGKGGALKLAVSDAGVLALLEGEEALWSSAQISAEDASALASSAGGASAY